jgi:hypothetical protein
MCLIVESRAIVHYPERKYKDIGTELLQTDLNGLGLVDQGAYLESQVFDPASVSIARGNCFQKVSIALAHM